MDSAKLQLLKKIKTALAESRDTNKRLGEMCESFLRKSPTHAFIPSDHFELGKNQHDIDQLNSLTIVIKNAVEKIDSKNKVGIQVT